MVSVTFHYSKFKQWPAVWTCNLEKRFKIPVFDRTGQISAMISTGPDHVNSRCTHSFLSSGNVIPLIHNATTLSIPTWESLDSFIIPWNPDFSDARFLEPIAQFQDSLFPALYRAWVTRTTSSFPSICLTCVHSNSWFLEPVIISLGVGGNPVISGSGNRGFFRIYKYIFGFSCCFKSTVNKITATLKNVRPVEYTRNFSW